jgi:hypothetical protein
MLGKTEAHRREWSTWFYALAKAWDNFGNRRDPTGQPGLAPGTLPVPA